MYNVAMNVVSLKVYFSALSSVEFIPNEELLGYSFSRCCQTASHDSYTVIQRIQHRMRAPLVPQAL